MSYLWNYLLYFGIFEAGMIIGSLLGKRKAYKHILSLISKGEVEITAFVEGLKKKYL
jgi:hypothetical protein